MKYRIVQLIHRVNELSWEDGGRASIEWIIEVKTLFGWKEVTRKELKEERISHKTYADAEAYLIANYMGHGLCKRIGHEYIYTQYTYTI